MASNFAYTDQDRILQVNWDLFKQRRDLSKFDIKLRNRWDEAMANSHFRYQLSDLETRIPVGKYKFVTQLNCKRGVERRIPQTITSLQTPFNASLFNFTRIPQHEILFSLQRANKDDESRHLVVINVSPLEYGHVLFVPELDSCLPQVLTQKSIELSLNLVLFSAHPGFRIGFNSLLAHASVNHLHLHAYYLEHELYIESAPVHLVHGELYELVDYPARCFVMQLHNSTVECLARQVFQVIDYLQRNDIAHNVFLTRGTVFNEMQSTVRVYIFPRLSIVGKTAGVDVISSETVDLFNVAVCELAGHIPTYTSSKFHGITEEYIGDRIRNQMLPSDKFNELRNEIVQLLFPIDLPRENRWIAPRGNDQD